MTVEMLIDWRVQKIGVAARPNDTALCIACNNPSPILEKRVSAWVTEVPLVELQSG